MRLNEDMTNLVYAHDGIFEVQQDRGLCTHPLDTSQKLR